MARYYFDIDDGKSKTIDDTGTEFEDVKQAQRAAARTVYDIGRDAGFEPTTIRVVVRNEQRNLFAIRLTFGPEEDACVADVT